MSGLAKGCLMLLLLTGVISDCLFRKISNYLILFGLGTGIVLRINGYMEGGMFAGIVGMLLPVVLLFVLFLLRMLGGGDVKLFGVAGLFCGVDGVCICMGIAFVVGAVLALAKMLWKRNFIERICYLRDYFQTFFVKKVPVPYYKEADGTDCILHFSIPVFVGAAVSCFVK